VFSVEAAPKLYNKDFRQLDRIEGVSSDGRIIEKR
jgi:hypothetical protein